MSGNRKGGAERTVEALERRIAQLEAALLEQDQGRQALLAMLEELEAGRALIERARMEWTAAFDAVRDPIFLHDREFRIVRANRAYAEAAGMDIKDVIGKPYWQVFPKSQGPLAACARYWKRPAFAM